jgi:hypothetical protein
LVGGSSEFEEIYEAKYMLDEEGSMWLDPAFLKRLIIRKLPEKCKILCIFK